MGLVGLIIWFLILLVLLTCFGAAAVAEFRSGHRGVGFLLSITESAAGMISSSALPSGFWGLTGLSPAWLSWTMVCVSLLMIGLALLGKYVSRAALSFVLVGNGLLALLWYFNGAYHNVTDDRTTSIAWSHEWDTDDPDGRIKEQFGLRPVSNAGIFSPPAIGQNGTIYLLRPHDYTVPKGLGLAAFDPARPWEMRWEIRPDGGVCTSPVIADDGTILFGTGAGNDPAGMGPGEGQSLAWAVSPDGRKKWTHEFPPASFFSARDFGGPAILPAKSPACSLIQDWSPEQISGWLKAQYPDNESMRVSHETIYRSLFIQARGVLKKELMDHLRSKRRMRRSRHASASGQSRGQIVDALSIRERPAEVEDRAVPGHWEGDLLAGAKNSYIATLVERHSRFAMLIRVPSKDTEVVVAALSRHVRKLPATLRRSLTRDRGLEMAKHKDFTVATDVKVYFCDPQSPWQRGTNENTNLLLRQYFPRGTDLSAYSQAQLDRVSLRLNQRPRKTLGFETPASRLHASVASTI